MEEAAQATSYTCVIFANEARKQLFAGIKETYEIVSSTLGPKGRTVLIQNGNKVPIVTKDGITVSKSLNFKDPVKRMGSKLITEASANTNDTAGDGTTTANVLSYAMIRECLKLTEAGYDAVELARGVEAAAKDVQEGLKQIAQQLTTHETVANVATISANGDKKMGDLVADALSKVGSQGIVTVEDAKGTETTLHVVDGMQFERGFLSSYFITNQDKALAAYENAYVLVTDKKLSSAAELIPALEQVQKSQRPLLVIADDIEGEALHVLVVNRLQAGLRVVGVKAPGYGQHKADMLNDICILTNAKLVSSSTGLSMKEVKLDSLGTCAKISVDGKSTTLVANNPKDLSKHVEDLKSQLGDVTLSSDDITKLRMRIAKLSNGVAVIRCGGVTEVDMVERKYRLEDSLNATRAALEFGIVPGGGIALWRVSELLEHEEVNKNFDAGYELVRTACKAPLRRICENANVSPDVIEMGIKDGKEYDARAGEYCDLIERGIIDPVRVEMMAIKNAASVAVTFLTLDGVVTDIE